MPVALTRNERSRALDRLRDRRLLRELAYIDGKWTAAGDLGTFPVTDPGKGDHLAWVAACGLAETDIAVAAAVKAQAEWAARLPQERSALLRAWYELLLAHAEDLALLMTLEQGKPLAEARGEIAYAASFVEWYAEETKRLNVESVTSHLPGAAMTVSREPLGVAALVTPWNFPSAMLTRKAAAALAAGCSVVAHPSSETPLSALALAELGERAGLPAGLFNLVTGEASTIVGRLCDHPAVAALSFTGSTEIGRLLAGRAGAGMKRLVMELGGHAPLLVFADSDLDEAVEIALGAKFATSGQDCLAANRIYVQRDCYAAFLARFTEAVRGLRVGHGLEPDVAIGPLMHARAVAKCEAHVTDAVERGARLLTGGERLGLGPNYYAPTVLAEVPEEALIMREETFGPVAALAPFDSEEEALARANATDYGLVAYLLTNDARRINRLTRALRFGMVAVNRVKITGAPIPFGGVKQSGLGREGSRHGLEAFTELKYVCAAA